MKRSELEAKALLSEREIVAIGFKFSWASGIVYAQLENSAMENDRFAVEPIELYHVLQDVRRRYGIVKTDAVEYAVLWHSHPRSPGPSSVDISEFPEHVVRWGIVYHTPTRTSRVYNSDGEIAVEKSLQSLVATEG